MSNLSSMLWANGHDGGSRIQGVLDQLAAPAVPDRQVEPAAQSSNGTEATIADHSSAVSLAPPADDSSQRDESSAELLMRAAAEARIFRATDGRSYAEVPVGDHREVHELRSSSFEFWLIRTYSRDQKGLPPAEALNRLVRVLEARAAALPATETVSVRVGLHSPEAEGYDHPAVAGMWAQASDPSAEAIYLDLGNTAWNAIEITAAGWRVVSRPPVLFRRPKGMRALPMPRSDGSIDLLRKYVNVTDDDFPLVVAWGTAAWRPVGPYPILIIGGEQGSAKSTLALVMRRLIDPSAALVRALPASQRDLMIEAHNTWLLAYDNISSISPSVSDAICRLATGGGLSTRAHFSNDEEVLFDVERPSIFTGIDELARRGDFLDRSVIPHLPRIPDTSRRLKRAFWAEFQSDYPLILGGLLTAVSGGLRMLPQVQLPALPRMADFAQWGEAVSLGLGWQPGTFLSRYLANRRDACTAALEDSPVVDALRWYLEGRWYRDPITGTASEILHELTRRMPQNITRSARWPKSPFSLSCLLRRLAPPLRTIGIDVTFERTKSARLIRLTAVDNDAEFKNALGADSETTPVKAGDAAGDAVGDASGIRPPDASR